MPPDDHRPFHEVIQELALAVLIVVGHTVLVALIIGVVWCTGWLLTVATHGDHEPQVFGVSARFIIEGGEIILIGVVLGMGIVSAFATLTLGLYRRIWRRK